MTDLTLSEYESFSEEELEEILREETRKMYSSESLENGFGEASSYLYIPFQHKHKATGFIFRNWGKIKDFIYSNIPKIFSNITGIGS